MMGRTLAQRMGAFILKQVHLCEAEGMQDFLDEDASEGRSHGGGWSHGGGPLLVAVKTLREDANKNARCTRSSAALHDATASCCTVPSP